MSEEEIKESKPVVARTPVDIQRIKLEKLMKNPEKAVIIPERPKERGAPIVPDFVRNVMGSSAGAGSGEFHVYRHLRRKEYARQHYMNEKAKWEKLEDEYHDKIDENKRKAEQVTAKKRAKRLKKKSNKKKPKMQKAKSSSSESESDSETEKENADKETETETSMETNNTITNVESKADEGDAKPSENDNKNEKDQANVPENETT
ncbi:PREDICTED: PRKR-interacting protein 1 homolog [Nicrophorus vespilloides]|uniref:PRKR-interacting protein 1 homolog n=1 Tax=Nicrophorus vespilloides TaxID=110193 RepID=A0ABM1M780_NICVS|nr:PREDICTED: PRKR-interacting protein 1 homolog [Nicrophorus vespilloides]